MEHLSRHERCVDKVSDGAIEYRLSRKVSYQRAAHEFAEARKRGLPSGSTIDISFPEDHAASPYMVVPR